MGDFEGVFILIRRTDKRRALIRRDLVLTDRTMETGSRYEIRVASGEFRKDSRVKLLLVARD